jgi:hypothetical protein
MSAKRIIIFAIAGALVYAVGLIAGIVTFSTFVPSF